MTRNPTASTSCSSSSRGPIGGALDYDGRHVRTECLDEISAGEGRPADAPDRSRCPRTKLSLGVLPQPGQRLLLGGLIQDQFTTNRCAHSAFSSAQGRAMARRVAFGPREFVPWFSGCRRRSDSVRPTRSIGWIVARPQRSVRGPPRPAQPSPNADPPSPIQPQRGVQLSPQRGLVDDPGGPGFMPQRVTVDGHQHPVGTGLLVGHQHMGVQVRIPGPRRPRAGRPPRPDQAAAADPSSRSCRAGVHWVQLAAGVQILQGLTDSPCAGQGSPPPWKPPPRCPTRAATTPTSGRKKAFFS